MGKSKPSSILVPTDVHTDATADRPFVHWVQYHAIRLRTVEAGHGFDDMQPLKKVIGSARIVALGEATHGTREFFQLKHRMIEFLASQMGFTVFAIEANMPEAFHLNDFVLNGKGDPRELLKGMHFWTWDTQEVLDIILWMRGFNQSGKGHIVFAGFDMQFPALPMETLRRFVERYDPSYLNTVDSIYFDVKHIASIGNSRQAAFGVATARFPVNAAAGKHIKYSGYIRTEGITQGFAGLWWRVDGEPGKVLAFDNMEDRGAKGTTPWARYEISLEVPAKARNINFGVLHPGNGTAWFDSLQVEIDGKAYTDTSLPDLDFESASLRGFHTGTDGYEVTLDKSVAHTGGQSLRIQLANTQPPHESALSQMLVALECSRVLEHLEARRAELEKKTNPKELDRAIQNAQLVLEYMQFKTGQKTRDECMADNVKWIADYSPGARVVLWAHNGHVSFQSTAMGEYLHKMFESGLVNFGFAFNQGSFRAVEIGKGLHDFAVGPAPEGTLDRTLAAAGIPLFALDLRRLPNQGPVARWFEQAHASRSIGALYSESDAAAAFVSIHVQDLFDAILFVEKTSASRELP